MTYNRRCSKGCPGVHGRSHNIQNDLENIGFKPAKIDKHEKHIDDGDFDDDLLTHQKREYRQDDHV